jgi:acyl-CoA-binding protein
MDALVEIVSKQTFFEEKQNLFKKMVDDECFILELILAAIELLVTGYMVVVDSSVAEQAKYLTDMTRGGVPVLDKLIQFNGIKKQKIEGSTRTNKETILSIVDHYRKNVWAGYFG